MMREAPEVLFQRNERLASFFAQRWRHSFPSWLWEDVLAEARLGLWRACRGYDPNRGVAFSTYAKRCIDNQLREFYRVYRRQPMPTVSLDAEVAGPEDDWGRARRSLLGSLIGAEERLFAEAEDRVFMESLPPVLRMVAAGMNQTQIARAMGKARATVHQRLQRERAQVRRWFEGRVAG